MSLRDFVKLRKTKAERAAPEVSQLLPHDVIERLEVTGRQELSGEFVRDQYMDRQGRPVPGPFDRGQAYGPVVSDIVGADAQRQEAWLSELAQVVVPHGGLAAVGASQTIVRTLGIEATTSNQDAAAVVDAALDYQRGQGVRWEQLSILERGHWEARRPGVPWSEQPLDPRPRAPRSSGVQMLYVSVYGATEAPAVFVDETAAREWLAEHHPESDWDVHAEMVKHRWNARIGWESMVETAKNEGWYRLGPQPDPPDQGAPDGDEHAVFAVHPGVTCYVYVDQSDAEANTFLARLSPLASQGFTLHTIELRRA